MSFRRLSAASALTLAVAFVVTGCSAGSASPTGAPSIAPSPAVSAAAEPTAPPASAGTESMAPASAEPPAATPDAPTPNPAAEALAARAWATAELTDVATGQPFTIADYAGRTIFVEQMAIWCSNCRAQQERFKEALDQLDPEKVAYVVLSVDPGETAEDLARYKDKSGFTGTYALAGTGVSKAIADEFGPNAINPPSVPLIVVKPDGSVSFGTGGESPDEIVKLAGG